MIDRDALISDAFPLIAWQATRFRSIPPGITADDLESVGNEALMQAAAQYDPACGTRFRAFAQKVIRNRMREVIRAARVRAGRRATMEIEHSDGTSSPRVDPRAADPSERAASRELVAGRRSVVRLGDDAPDPAVVANRAAELRAVMFGAITDEDTRAIVEAVARKAKGGDLKAAALFFDLIAPPRAGQVVHQQAIIIRPDDLD